MQYILVHTNKTIQNERTSKIIQGVTQGLTQNQGCQLSRIWCDSHAFDLLLTHSRNLQIYSRI